LVEVSISKVLDKIETTAWQCAIGHGEITRTKVKGKQNNQKNSREKEILELRRYLVA
jgi:hypothetical protein